MHYFQYGQTEIEYLKERDPALGRAIDEIGRIERPVFPEVFTALVRSIVGQQISTKAAATVWRKLGEKFAGITPQSIAGADLADIQACGMSLRKAEYIRGIAGAVVNGDLDIAALREMSDEEVIQKLAALRGIGVWTAEMVLIFSLGRPDVVSWGDIGIRRGMMRLYGLAELTRAQFEEYRKRYSPYGSVASLYLWAIAAR
jgi:3-methyladenine DNA glycosylase/8-oxoguanine DNA glycosylase